MATRPQPPAGYFTTICPPYASAANGLHFPAFSRGRLTVAGFFKAIVLPPAPAPSSTATAKEKREHSDAVQERTEVLSLWRHMQTMHAANGQFPAALQYLYEHAMFVVRAMAPPGATIASLQRRVLHLNPMSCPDKEFFETAGDGGSCGICFSDPGGAQ